MRISILGAGSWGSALTIAFSQVASQIILYSRNRAQVEVLQNLGTNSLYLVESVRFADNVSFTDDLIDCQNSELLIIATPIDGLRDTLRQIKAIFEFIPDLFVASKGIEAKSGLLAHQIINQELFEFNNYGFLLGPSFAQEVATSLPTALCLVSSDIEYSEKWIYRLSNIRNFRLYANGDVVGSEVGAAVKNVLAIAVGISDGMMLGYNARAALMTRSLSELAALVISLGGERSTIYGLTGMGDLILTCTGDLSRNRKVGQKLAAGESIEQIIEDLGHVAEGVSTAREIYLMANQLKIDMPIVSSVYRIIYERSDIRQEIFNLINRPLKSEF